MAPPGCGPSAARRQRAWNSLVPRLEVALAVIAALRAPRRAIAAGLELVALARLVATAALHHYAAALAVLNHAALAGRLSGDHGIVAIALARGLTGKVGAGRRGDLLAELLAQHAGLHLVDLAFLEFAQLERTVGDPDQPVHLEAEMRQHVAHLAVLALADRKHQPDIGALVALQRGVDRAVFDAVDLDALFELVELGLGHFAMGAHPVAPQPAGVGQFQRARQPAVIG